VKCRCIRAVHRRAWLARRLKPPGGE
jgi:hypothetical protein